MQKYKAFLRNFDKLLLPAPKYEIQENKINLRIKFELNNDIIII